MPLGVKGFTKENASAAAKLEWRQRPTRTWYQHELVQIVKGEKKLSKAEYQALTDLARSKGWNKPGKTRKPAGRPFKPLAGVTADLAARLNQ